MHVPAPNPASHGVQELFESVLLQGFIVNRKTAGSVKARGRLGSTAVGQNLRVGQPAAEHTTSYGNKQAKALPVAEPVLTVAALLQCVSENTDAFLEHRICACTP